MKVNSKNFVLVMLLLSTTMIHAQNTEEAPRVVLFFGRFHPLLLHLPIGALVVTFFIDVMGRIKKNYPTVTIRYMLAFSAAFSVITCLLGYFLSLEGGYGSETLDIHFYTGLLTALLAIVLFYLSKINTNQSKKWFLPAFILTLISISVTGHYGSVLTHGDNYITEYARPAKKARTVEVIDSLRIYNDVIARILDDKCVQCHNPNKTKGELNLATTEGILKGGETGEALIINNAHKSLMVEQVLLPITDEDHMPPEGKPQLTKAEIWLIKHWIDQGADFESLAVIEQGNDSLKNHLEKYLVFEKIYIPRAARSNIAKVEEAGFMVNELFPGSAELSVKYLKKEPKASDASKLSAIKNQIVELDFSNGALTDGMTSVFRKFKNLKMLRMDNSQITDKSLKNLRNLKHLDVLNLYNTQITEKGLGDLLAVNTPSQIYTWKTQIPKSAALELAQKYELEIHNGMKEGFVVKSKLEAPSIIPDKTLFVDNLEVKLESKFRNVELRYTLNGNDPDSTSTLFENPIAVNNSKNLKVRAFKKGWLPSDVLEKNFFKINNKITDYTIVHQPEQRYPKAEKLFDLEEASITFNDGKWTGYLGDDLITTINLGEQTEIENISINCLENIASWILFPTQMKVYVSDQPNGRFKELGTIDIPKPEGGRPPNRKKYTVNIPKTTAQYFKVVVKNPKKLPSWHEGAGNPSWIFVDEIFVW